MILYRKTLATQGPYILRLTLDQMGAVSKPYFLLVLEHRRTDNHLPKPPLSFFLEQQGDGTEPIEATVAFAQRLERQAALHGFDKCLQLAQMIHQECQWSEEWSKTYGILARGAGAE